MQVEDIMSHPVISVEISAPARTALRAMERFNFRHVPVMDDMRLVGIISDRDFAVTASMLRITGCNRTTYENLLDRPIENMMRACFRDGDLASLRPTDEVEHAIDTMVRDKLDAMPVIDRRGAVVGVVSYLDLLEAVKETVRRFGVARTRPAVKVERGVDRLPEKATG